MMNKTALDVLHDVDAVAFLVDGTHWNEEDEYVLSLIKKVTVPCFLVVNKVDNGQRNLDATEFYSLGFDTIYTVSCLSGTGTGELLDAIAEALLEQQFLSQESISAIVQRKPPARVQHGVELRAPVIELTAELDLPT